MKKVNLCFDGKWTTILVDNFLPVVQISSNNGRRINFRDAAIMKKGDTKSSIRRHAMAYPTFCAVPKGILWPTLVATAYAKAPGSYANLPAGYLTESFTDLTGAPTETICLSHEASNRTSTKKEQKRKAYHRTRSMGVASTQL